MPTECRRLAPVTQWFCVAGLTRISTLSRLLRSRGGHYPGRLRLLSCGCCRTRWRYRRTGCPFCENRDAHRLAVLDVEGEAGLRIDYCESCLGYLKTYNGEGSEGLLPADWTSLHLDVLTRDRGLTRQAASLYEL